MNEQSLKTLESVLRQLRKHLSYAEDFVQVSADEVIRIYHNIMEYGVSVIIVARYFIASIEEFQRSGVANNDVTHILEVVGDYKRFQVDITVDGIIIRTNNGYIIGEVEAFETEALWLEVDEYFSIAKYRRYINNILEGEVIPYE